MFFATVINGYLAQYQELYVWLRGILCFCAILQDVCVGRSDNRMKAKKEKNQTPILLLINTSMLLLSFSKPNHNLKKLKSFTSDSFKIEDS